MKMPRARLLAALGAALFGAFWISPALGVRPQAWQIDEPADFLAGTLENVVLSSRAELLLGLQTQRYELDSKEADTVNTVVMGPDNLPYLGTGPSGAVYRIVNDVPRRFVEVPEGQVFSLLFLEDDSLLVGTGGRRGVIYRVRPDGQRTLFWESSARYVWSMVRDEAGNIYAATGTSGEVYRIPPDGGSAVAIVSLRSTKNILSLAMAGKDRLVFGTDANGLVGTVDLRSGRVRILFDAGERSVSAISPQADGTIYVATTRSGEKGGTGSGPTPTRPQGHPDTARSPQGPGSQAAGGTLADLPGSATLPAGKTDRSGNAIYQIDPSGVTSEILALPAMFLSMAPADGNLMVGTGSPGRVYKVQPGTERYTALVREDAAFFSAAVRADNSFWIGTSRPAAAIHIRPDYSHEGTYTSVPQDAGQVSQWGRISADLLQPAGTSVMVQTRSGNLRDVSGPGWSEWSEPTSLDEGTDNVPSCPPARFLQLRLTLKANSSGRDTPVVGSIRIPYMTRNLAPEITAVSVTVPDLTTSKRGSGNDEWYTADSNLPIEWQARDPNGDSLVYCIDLRQAGHKRWIRIAKDIHKTSYTWDSSTVPDGRYEIRVLASDAPDNPPGTALSKARISEPFTVNNTPPQIEDLHWAATNRDGFRIQAALHDADGTILAAQYAIDSVETWTALLPADGIFDSPSESLDLNIEGLSSGEHILTLRVADSRGNTARAWLTLTVR
jgi:hypothetical protein